MFCSNYNSWYQKTTHKIYPIITKILPLSVKNFPIWDLKYQIMYFVKIGDIIFGLIVYFLYLAAGAIICISWNGFYFCKYQTYLIVFIFLGAVRCRPQDYAFNFVSDKTKISIYSFTKFNSFRGSVIKTKTKLGFLRHPDA